MDGIIREDLALQNRDKEIIIGELKTPKETKIAVEVSNEELSLAQEFGAANLLGSGRSMTNNPSARDNLSDKPKLKKSRATNDIKVHKSPTTHATPTWRRRERKKPRDNTATSIQSQGRKRMAGIEVDHTEVSAMRFQAAFSGENKPFVVARADVQPRQQQ